MVGTTVVSTGVVVVSVGAVVVVSVGAVVVVSVGAVVVVSVVVVPAVRFLSSLSPLLIFPITPITISAAKTPPAILRCFGL